MNYSPTISDHFHHPRNCGAMDRADAVGEAENPVCLDRLRVYLRLDRASGTIAEATFQAEGCVPTLAVGSLLTELLRGKRPSELLPLTAEDVERELGGLPATKKHAAHLAVEALQAALAQIISADGATKAD